MTGSYNDQYISIFGDRINQATNLSSSSTHLIWDPFESTDTLRHKISFALNWRYGNLPHDLKTISIAYCFDVIKSSNSRYSKKPVLKVAVAPTAYLVSHARELYGDMIDPRRGIVQLTDDGFDPGFNQNFIDVNAGIYFNHGRTSAGYSVINVRDQYQKFKKNYYTLQRSHLVYLSYKVFLTRRAVTETYLRYRYTNGLQFSEAGISALVKRGMLFQLALVDLNKIKTVFAINLTRTLDINLRANWHVTEARKDFGLISSFGIGIRYKSNKIFRDKKKDEVDDPNYGN